MDPLTFSGDLLKFESSDFERLSYLELAYVAVVEPDFYDPAQYEIFYLHRDSDSKHVFGGSYAYAELNESDTFELVYGYYINDDWLLSLKGSKLESNYYNSSSIEIESLGLESNYIWSLGGEQWISFNAGVRYSEQESVGVYRWGFGEYSETSTYRYRLTSWALDLSVNSYPTEDIGLSLTYDKVEHVDAQDVGFMYSQYVAENVSFLFGFTANVYGDYQYYNRDETVAYVGGLSLLF